MLGRMIHGPTYPLLLNIFYLVNPALGFGLNLDGLRVLLGGHPGIIVRRAVVRVDNLAANWSRWRRVGFFVLRRRVVRRLFGSFVGGGVVVAVAFEEGAVLFGARSGSGGAFSGRFWRAAGGTDDGFVFLGPP